MLKRVHLYIEYVNNFKKEFISNFKKEFINNFKKEISNVDGFKSGVYYYSVTVFQVGNCVWNYGDLDTVVKNKKIIIHDAGEIGMPLDIMLSDIYDNICCMLLSSNMFILYSILGTYILLMYYLIVIYIYS